ncbi:hypothetical protein [Shewanella sp.]|uniref:hypothetical protein n=1 Tax=Shewanella sp. TaxID=50422 RepID=UPI003D1091FD
MDDKVVPLHVPLHVETESPEEREAFERMSNQPRIGDSRWRYNEQRQHEINRIAAVVRLSPTMSAESIATLLYDAGCQLPEPQGAA